MTPQKLSDAIFSEIDRQRSITLVGAVHTYVVSFLQAVATANDLRAGADKASAADALRALKAEAEDRGMQGELRYWTTDHIDRFCVAELGRTSLTEP